MKKARIGTGFALTLILLAAAALAQAAEVTRSEYVQQAEPICRADTKANEQILSGVSAEVKAGKLKPAAKRFARAAVALKQAMRQLEAIPQPTADEARLEKWFSLMAQEVAQFEAVARKLKAGDKAGAEKMVVRLVSTATQANNQVVAFEFHYCRLNPSKFR